MQKISKAEPDSPCHTQRLEGERGGEERGGESMVRMGGTKESLGRRLDVVLMLPVSFPSCVRSAMIIAYPLWSPYRHK